MEEKIQEKKKINPCNRISIKDFLEKQLDTWIARVKDACPQIKINKSDLIHWMCNEQGDEPTPKQINAIRDKYFDEGDWTIAEIKRRKANGEKFRIKNIKSPLWKNNLKPENIPGRKSNEPNSRII